MEHLNILLPTDAVDDTHTYQEGRSKQPLDEWLVSHKPSESTATTPSQGGSGWYWIRRDIEIQANFDHDYVEAKANEIRKQVEEECKRIKDNADIPVRTSKKEPHNKAYHRERAHKEAKDALLALALESGCTSGKWLVYPPNDTFADAIFEKIARAMIEPKGALRRTAVVAAKVGALANEETRVICVYVPDLWDEPAVKLAGEVLINEMELTTRSFKADVYTLGNIDSKNSSMIKTSLYTPDSLGIDLKAMEKIRNEKREASKGVPEKRSLDAEQQRIKETGGFEDDDDEDDAPPAKKSKKA